MEFDSRNCYEAAQDANIPPQCESHVEKDPSQTSSGPVPEVPQDNGPNGTWIENTPNSYYPSACTTPMPGFRHYSYEPWMPQHMMMDILQSPIPNDVYNSNRRLSHSDSKILPYCHSPWSQAFNYRDMCAYPMCACSAPPKSRSIYADMNPYSPCCGISGHLPHELPYGPLPNSEPRKKTSSNRSSRARRRLGFDSGNQKSRTNITDQEIRQENLTDDLNLRPVESVQAQSEVTTNTIGGGSFIANDTSFYGNDTSGLLKNTTATDAEEDEIINAKDVNDLLRKLFESDPSKAGSASKPITEQQSAINSISEVPRNSHNTNDSSEDFMTQLLTNNNHVLLSDENAIFEVSYLSDGTPCVSLKLQENDKSQPDGGIESVSYKEVQQPTGDLINASLETPPVIQDGNVPVNSIQTLASFLSNEMALTNGKYPKGPLMSDNHQAPQINNFAIDVLKNENNYSIDFEQVCNDLFDDLAPSIFDKSISFNHHTENASDMLALTLPESSLGNDFNLSTMFYAVEVSTQTEMSYSFMKDSATQTDNFYNLNPTDNDLTQVFSQKSISANRNDASLSSTIAKYEEFPREENDICGLKTKAILSNCENDVLQELIDEKHMLNAKKTVVSKSFYKCSQTKRPAKVIEKTTTIIMYDEGTTNNYIEQLNQFTLGPITETDELVEDNKAILTRDDYPFPAIENPKILGNKNRRSALKNVRASISHGKTVTFDPSIPDCPTEEHVKTTRPKKKSPKKKITHPKPQVTIVPEPDTPEENVKLVEQKCRDRSNGRYMLRKL